MKNLLHKLIFPAFMLALAPACERYLDVNDNPNTAVEAPLDGLLAAATQQTGLNHFRMSGFTSFFVQYLASPNTNDLNDTYQQADYSSVWGQLYQAMTNARDLIDQAEARGGNRHAGMGRIIMAIHLGLVVDAWGDAPYSDAFSGATLAPAYDAAPALYERLFDLLDRAIADLQAGDPLRLDPSSDFIHSGKVEAWIKTAYGLRARYRNHFSKRADYDPLAVLADVRQAYAGNEDDAQVTRFQVRNPWAQVAINNANLVLGGWLSAHFVDALDGDPRLPRITRPLPDGSFAGTPNGAGRRGDGTKQEECYLSLDGAYSQPGAPLPVLTYAELKFIEAEAALRAALPEQALEAFFAGVRAHMRKLGLSEEAIENHLAGAYPGLDAAGLRLSDIFREKYIVMFLHPEAWVDARRFDYGYQRFALPANAALNEFIRRVQYPATELDRNRQHTPLVRSLAERLFWDVSE
jgi:hypothetical protein